MFDVSPYGGKLAMMIIQWIMISILYDSLVNNIK